MGMLRHGNILTNILTTPQTLLFSSFNFSLQQQQWQLWQCFCGFAFTDFALYLQHLQSNFGFLFHCIYAVFPLYFHGISTVFRVFAVCLWFCIPLRPRRPAQPPVCSGKKRSEADKTLIWKSQQRRPSRTVNFLSNTETFKRFTKVHNFS